MSCQLVWLAQRNITDRVALEDAVVLRIGKAKRIARWIIDIYAVKHGELRNEGVYRIHAKSDAIVRGAWSPETGKCEAARVVSLRQGNFIVQNSAAKDVAGSRLDAEDLLRWLSVNVGEAHAAATGRISVFRGASQPAGVHCGI